MKRKLGKENIKLFVLFSFLVIGIVCLFGYALYNTLSYDRTVYDVASGSFTYDKDNNYVKLEDKGSLTQKWDKHYYLTLDKSTTDLGEDVIIYHDNDYKLYIYGNNYQVKLNGDVTYSSERLEVARNGASSFYKLADRKYLIVGKNIKTENGEISTSGYLIVDIDKSGNALLLNNELNIKVLSKLNLLTDSFDFDVANERLLVDEKLIDLKKINGSSNQYVEPVPEEEEDKDKDKDKNTTNVTNNNTTNNNTTNNTIIGGAVGGSTGGSSSKQEQLVVTKSLALTAVNAYTSYIDINYIVNDPKNEYSQVWLTITGPNEFENTISLSKTNNKYRIRDLSPNTEYVITLGYSYLNSANMVMDEIANVVNTKTKKITSRLVINKVSATKIYYTVYYDPSYAYDSANVNLYSDGNKLGIDAVNTVKALSNAGYSGVIDAEVPLGYEIILKLEDCKFEGEDVASTVQSKFINR